MIDAKGSVKISDFGCARIEAASMSLAAITKSEKGTYHYWAPELTNSSPHSKETDVWAFGMTVYVSISHIKAVVYLMQSLQSVY